MPWAKGGALGRNDQAIAKDHATEMRAERFLGNLFQEICVHATLDDNHSAVDNDAQILQLPTSGFPKHRFQPATVRSMCGMLHGTRTRAGAIE
tara:strand:- start:257 stop:535 length:279 start_codon:yes stop_codon:yes gene_type:complete